MEKIKFTYNKEPKASGIFFKAAIVSETDSGFSVCLVDRKGQMLEGSELVTHEANVLQSANLLDVVDRRKVYTVASKGKGFVAWAERVIKYDIVYS